VHCRQLEPANCISFLTGTSSNHFAAKQWMSVDCNKDATEAATNRQLVAALLPVPSKSPPEAATMRQRRCLFVAALQYLEGFYRETMTERASR
jgi:hypothetical protein